MLFGLCRTDGSGNIPSHQSLSLLLIGFASRSGIRFLGFDLWEDQTANTEWNSMRNLNTTKNNISLLVYFFLAFTWDWDVIFWGGVLLKEKDWHA